MLHYIGYLLYVFVLPHKKAFVLLCAFLWFVCNFAFVAFVASHFCIWWVCRMFFCICCICILHSKTFTDCTILNVLSSDPRLDQNAPPFPPLLSCRPFTPSVLCSDLYDDDNHRCDENESKVYLCAEILWLNHPKSWWWRFSIKMIVVILKKTIWW